MAGCFETPKAVLAIDHRAFRGSCAASYNPDIQSREINERIKKGAQMPPKERSQAQAFYICWCWGKEADDALNSAKRRRVA